MVAVSALLVDAGDPVQVLGGSRPNLIDTGPRLAVVGRLLPMSPPLARLGPKLDTALNGPLDTIGHKETADLGPDPPRHTAESYQEFDTRLPHSEVCESDRVVSKSIPSSDSGCPARNLTSNAL